MKPNKKSGNLDRLKELNELLTYEPEEGINELLVKVNDELKSIKEHLNNGRSNENKIKFCKNKVNGLISELKKIKNDDGG